MRAKVSSIAKPFRRFAVAVLPDFASMRSQWHQSDAYKLWKEPAVQDFLQRPLATNPAAGEPTRSFQELETLRPGCASLERVEIEKGSRREGADFNARHNSASLPRRLRPLRRFLNSPWA